MKRTNPRAGRGRGYYGRYLAHYTKKHRAILLLGGLFLIGVLLGTLLIRSAGSDTLSLLLRMFSGYVEKRRERSLLQNFTAGAGGSLLFVAVLFVCGFCAVAQPAVAAVPLFRGLGFGFTAASLYARYGVDAAGFIAVLLIPGMLLSTLAVLICCQESLSLSGSLFAQLGSSQREIYPLRIYLARYLSAGVLCLLSAFLEAVLYTAFSGSFLLP